MAVPQLSCGLSPRTCRAAYAPFKPNKSGQRSHPPYYRGCWHGVSRCFFNRYRRFLPQELFLPGQKTFTTQKAFIRHAAWLGQARAHCPIFPTAASRRSLARISVPVWGIGLSAPLAIVALVSRYLTNQLMARRLICTRISFTTARCRAAVVCGINPPFGGLSPRCRQIAYALRTRAPLWYRYHRSTCMY